jgi:hypothetical protein
MDKMTPDSLRDAIHQVAGHANAPYTPPHLMQEGKGRELSPNILPAEWAQNEGISKVVGKGDIESGDLIRMTTGTYGIFLRWNVHTHVITVEWAVKGKFNLGKLAKRL